jgi:hypothetical protein
MKKSDTQSALAAVKVQLERGTSPPTLFKNKSVSGYNPKRRGLSLKMVQPFTILTNPPPLYSAQVSPASLTVRLYKSLSMTKDGQAVVLKKPEIRHYFPDKDYNHIFKSLHARGAHYCKQYAPKSRVKVRPGPDGSYLIHRESKPND